MAADPSELQAAKQRNDDLAVLRYEHEIERLWLKMEEQASWTRFINSVSMVFQAVIIPNNTRYDHKRWEEICFEAVRIKNMDFRIFRHTVMAKRKRVSFFGRVAGVLTFAWRITFFGPWHVVLALSVRMANFLARTAGK